MWGITDAALKGLGSHKKERNFTSSARTIELGVAYTCQSRAPETEAEGSRVQGHPGLHSKTLSQTQENTLSLQFTLKVCQKTHYSHCDFSFRKCIDFYHLPS